MADQGSVSHPMMIRAVPFVEPADAFASLADEPWAMLMHGAAPGSCAERYAYAMVRPRRTIVSRADGVRVNGLPVTGDPFAVLQAHLTAGPIGDAPVPFAGGAAGFLAYELGRHLERAPARPPADLPEMAIGIYDAVLAFDLHRRQAWTIAAGPEAAATAELLADCAATAAAAAHPWLALPSVTWTAECSRQEYLARVRRIIELIHAGDVFQVNLTQRFLALRPAGLAPFALYRRLRRLNPAPFAAYLNCGPELAVVSASPERFLRLGADGTLEARPIKGTRRRASDPAADLCARAELAASRKDRAENLMITDLLRNDIGRVARVGSVRVPSLCDVESVKNLHHLVSVVSGQLGSGLAAVDVLRAAFPGGSITGAPKVRAMEIIDELEPAPRGPYCGAAVWIGRDGAMDSSILIRTLVVTRDQLIAQAGGGIVAESDPVAEYCEMMDKVAPALAALGTGKG